MSTAVSIRLSDEIAYELEGLARTTERSRMYIICKAIESYLQEYADYLVAIIDAGIDRSFVVSDGSPVSSTVVLKARRPGRIVDRLIEEGYTEFVFAEKLFSDDELITGHIPEKGDYFSMIYAGGKER